jgi:hypothetical protein
VKSPDYVSNPDEVIRFRAVIPDKQFAVVYLPELKWPSNLEFPSARFRLLVAADTENLPVEVVSEFACAALSRGMVYFCAWGPGCSRFHDIVDEEIVADEIGERRFIPASKDDFVVTAWHENDTLEEALDFLATCAYPTDGFAPGSAFRLVMCVGNTDWARISHGFLEAADFFV